MDCKIALKITNNKENMEILNLQMELDVVLNFGKDIQIINQRNIVVYLFIYFYFGI